jgi:SRSO17 transposase
VAAGLSVDPARWRDQFDELMGRIAGRFARVEPRRRARAFVLGLLSGLRRKNCWTIAELAGDLSPDGMQHLLAAARWDADAVRDDLRGYVIEHLGSADAVLVVDETGDVKKGRASAGVQRQYSGTAGRVENCQVAVFLSYASPAGHALIDRELYLPRSWAADPARCAVAGIPQDMAVFATKPALARRMLGRALDAGVPAAWVTGDEVYGADPGLRADLEARRTGYVLAVAAGHRVATAAGTCPAGQLAARLPRRAWQRYSAGPGAKGHRYYDWAWAVIDLGRPGHRWLLIRRNRRTRELAFYRCYSPRPVPLPVLVTVAGTRWTTEENFQAGKAADRTGRPSGPPLGLLVPVDHPGHARPGLPVHHRRRARPPARRPDPAHPQRDRRAVQHADHGPGEGRPAPAAMVSMAAPSSATRPGLPLPAAGR